MEGESDACFCMIRKNMKNENIKLNFLNPKKIKDIGKKIVLITTLGSVLLTGCSTKDLGKNKNYDSGISSSIDSSVVGLNDDDIDLTEFKKDIYVDVSGFEYSSSSEKDYIMFIGTDRLLVGLYLIEGDTQESNVYNVRADVSSIYSIDMDMEVELPKIELDEQYRILLDYTNKKIDINVEKARTYSR